MRDWIWKVAGRGCVGVFAYVALAVALTGCDRTPERPRGGVALPPGATVAVIGSSQAHPSWRGIRGGAERYGRERAYVTCLTAAPSSDEPAALVALVDEVCARNPLAVCLYVEEPEAARAAAQRINQRGILLVTMGAALEEVGAYGHVGVNLPEAAEILGRNLDRVASGRLSYVLLHENGEDRTASLCYARFTAAARSRSSLVLLEERNAAEVGGQRQELVREAIGRFRHVGLVVTLNPEPWLSLQPRFRLPAENRFATLAAAPRLWSRLRSGEAAALVGPLDGEIGFAAVDLAVQGLMLIPDAQRERVIRCELVTAETLDDFSRRYAAAAGLEPADLLPFGNALQPASQPGGD